MIVEIQRIQISKKFPIGNRADNSCTKLISSFHTKKSIVLQEFIWKRSDEQHIGIQINSAYFIKFLEADEVRNERPFFFPNRLLQKRMFETGVSFRPFQNLKVRKIFMPGSQTYAQVTWFGFSTKPAVVDDFWNHFRK